MSFRSLPLITFSYVQSELCKPSLNLDPSLLPFPCLQIFLTHTLKSLTHTFVIHSKKFLFSKIFPQKVLAFIHSGVLGPLLLLIIMWHYKISWHMAFGAVRLCGFICKMPRKLPPSSPGPSPPTFLLISSWGLVLFKIHFIHFKSLL